MGNRGGLRHIGEQQGNGKITLLNRAMEAWNMCSMRYIGCPPPKKNGPNFPWLSFSQFLSESIETQMVATFKC